ncbi:F-box/kelch-repeat protein At3g06240-like [Rhododendron vialii]|uniref:F-box/kelch-repeat protein At3g06240-like n=1 Tax=Rhododendron vialii TaxID=182163 RepID=UPI00265D6733|nr:F-box/kelch-repeat protein At3g06240-like [Rhododendron vialii]XP_058198351.1 F-box/kelch-repeat protein At3g06240-like [Rhododendron vialii]
MSNGGTLALDIVIDILSRLPVKSLCRFKSVSPSWNSLISDPYFAKAHLNRAKTQNPKNLDQKLIIISTHHNLYSVDFADVNPTIKTLADFSSVRIRVLSSCDGLLLVSLVDNSNFLWNPSTREYKVLATCPSALGPVRGVFRDVYGVGYDSSTDDYKVLKIVYNETETYSPTERGITIGAIYSLKTNAWRKIQDTIDYVPCWTTSCGFFFSGCLHFLCWKRTGSFVIVAFNLSDEIFREVLLPASFCGLEILDYRVAVVGGCLCLADLGESYVIETTGGWMMKEYGVRESWTKFPIDVPKRYAVELLCLPREDEYLLKTRKKIHDRSYGDKLVVYNFKNGTLGDVVVHGSPTGFTFGSTYVESLVSPYYRGEIGRQ